MLNKKYYVEIAKILKSSQCLDDIIGQLCDFFAEDNPKFDEDNFLKACGCKYNIRGEKL